MTPATTLHSISLIPLYSLTYLLFSSIKQRKQRQTTKPLMKKKWRSWFGCVRWPPAHNLLFNSINLSSSLFPLPLLAWRAKEEEEGRAACWREEKEWKRWSELIGWLLALLKNEIHSSNAAIEGYRFSSQSTQIHFNLFIPFQFNLFNSLVQSIKKSKTN